MTVHNHDLDPSCREITTLHGVLRGECMVKSATTGPALPDNQEHYPGCPCGRCQQIRKVAHDLRWASLNIIDRLQESLNAKIEGDNGRLPERGMLNLADVQALINMVKNHAMD